MKLLYLEESMWEYDYIRYDILSDVSNIEVEFFNKSTLLSLLTRDDLTNNNIFVINSVCSLDNVLAVVSHIKPLVIFDLSDEVGNRPDWTILDKHTKLLFRQYNHTHYRYGSNNFHLPLGYVKNFINNNISANIPRRKMADRIFNCSFIGVNKSDRSHMCRVFGTYMNNTNLRFVNNTWDVDNLQCSPNELFKTYNNSIFVLNGRGNCNLNCFRIYEAIVAGAIPVIVGRLDEIKNTFNFDNNIPPFVHAENWEKAIVLCNNLLSDMDNIQNIQDKLIDWWNNYLSTIRKKITDTILVLYNK